MKNSRFSTHTILSLLPLLAAGCFGGTEPGPAPGPAPEPPEIQARDRAREVILDQVDSAFRSLEESVDSPENPFTALDAWISGQGLSGPAQAAATALSEAPGRQEAGEIFDALFDSGRKLGDGHFVFSPRPDFCTVILELNHPEACNEVFSRARLHLQASGPGTGAIRLDYNGFQPLELEYDRSGLSLRTDVSVLFQVLAEVQAIIEAIDGDGGPELPATTHGRLLVRLNRESPDSVRLEVTVEEPIEVLYSQLGDPFSGPYAVFAEATGGPQFLYLARRGGEAYSVDFDIPVFQLFMTREDGDSTQRHLLAAMADGRVDVDVAARRIQAEMTDYGLAVAGPDGFTVAQGAGLALDFRADQSGADVDIAFGSPMTVNILAEESLSILFDGDAAMRVHGNGVTEVVEGVFRVAGSSETAEELVLDAPSCFVWMGAEGSILPVSRRACEPL